MKITKELIKLDETVLLTEKTNIAHNGNHYYKCLKIFKQVFGNIKIIEYDYKGSIIHIEDLIIGKRKQKLAKKETLISKLQNLLDEGKLVK